MTRVRYVLGVDGGNSKTDYLLYDMDGSLIQHLRAGTCSHEALGMAGAHREMDARIGALLHAAGVPREAVVSAAFGLAGIDQPVQQRDLEAIVREMGFSRSVAVNDSFLGIKAGSEKGYGVCSINGTGTAAGGIDAQGSRIQVGGYGAAISGDEAGGSYLAARTIRAAYDAIFRFGEDTSLRGEIVRLFGCKKETDLHEAVSTGFMYGDAVTPLMVLQRLFAASENGDATAGQLVRQTADALARSAAGCAVRLRFEGAIPVVLIGSVWTKGRHQPMIDHFKAMFTHYAQQPCALHILEVPPAVGSILWALELAEGHVPTPAMRQKVIAQANGL